MTTRLKGALAPVLTPFGPDLEPDARCPTRSSSPAMRAGSAAGFDIFPAESFLSVALPLGAAGCISATVNMNPAGIHRLYRNWDRSDGAALQAAADAVRKIFQGPQMIPAMKFALADHCGDAQWCAVRPPLVSLDAQSGASLMANLAVIEFAMPGVG